MNKSNLREEIFKLVYSLEVQKEDESSQIDLYLENSELSDKEKEKIDVMIDDNYMNCLEIAEKNIKTLYFRDAGIKEIKNNPHITEVHNWGEIYKYIHMYNNEINS